MGKNVAVFVDVANIFYAAKAAGVDIDYVTLLKASSAGRDLVRAYAYTGLDPDNENQRNFHDFLRRHGYRVVSKDIRKYGDGKVKANLDIELVVDMMKTARNLDVAIVVSGDGDFAPAIRAVQEQGVRVEVVSFRGNTSSDLMDVADLFTDITQIAKVEKGSSRSGRRVADDDMDLSMTEVPDKQSEGTGDRMRGRGRTRRTTSTTGTTATRGRSIRPAATAAEAGDGVLVALPGEKLSRAAALPGEKLSRAAAAPPIGNDDFEELDDEMTDLEGGEGATDETGSEDGLRRRRRRGGRGRGRGRAPGEAEGIAPRVAASGDEDADEDVQEDEAPPAPSRRAASTFGSVWDSQIGVPTSSRQGRAPASLDDEDLEEPAVPEYLLTERRQRDAGRGGQRGGGRGRGGAYAAAVERERFGGGRGTTPSRYAEPPRGRDSGYARSGDRDRVDRDRGGRGGDRDRGDRNFREVSRPAPRPSGDEPWSEVPPEIEAMLRAQMGSRPAAGRPAGGRPAPARQPLPVEPEASSDAPAEEAAAPAARRTRTRRPSSTEAPAEVVAAETTETETEAAPKAPARRSRATASAATGSTEVEVKPARRTSTRKAAASTTTADADAAADTTGETAAVAAPKRRVTRKKAEPEA